MRFGKINNEQMLNEKKQEYRKKKNFILCKCYFSEMCYVEKLKSKDELGPNKLNETF